MYKYEYVTVYAKTKMFSTDFEEHKDVIEEYAKNGWRFVNAIPVSTYGYGQSKRSIWYLKKKLISRSFRETKGCVQYGL